MTTSKTQQYLSTLLPEAGFVRLPTILQIIPIGKSSWWAGVKEGRFPKSVKLGKRTTAWRVEDIRKLIENDAEIVRTYEKN